MCTQLTAQDVTVMPLEWLGQHDQGDELPAMKGFAEPKFPIELSKTTQIGWAEIEMYVDDKGTVHSKEAHGTLPRYEEAAAASYHKVSFEPSRRDGTPIAARLHQVFLFNPASAVVEGPDATPRLLRAGMIVDPARRVVAEIARPEPEIVWVLAIVDESGKVSEVLAPTARLTKLIGAGMAGWRFAPARRGGVPQKAKLRLPVILSAPGGLAESLIVPARVRTQAAPLFPVEALRRGEGGAVLLRFVVDTDGKTRDIEVRRSSNPVFSSAARVAISKWTFAPALNDGKPVESRYQQLVSFTLDDRPPAKQDDSGGRGVTVLDKGNQSKLPEELRYDTAPKVWRLEQPKYPYALLSKSVKGSAQVALVIGPDGRIAVSKVVHASSPEFGYALQAAVEQFVYEPAIKNGDPTQTMVRVEQKFETKPPGEDLVVTDEERTALKLEQKNSDQIAKGSELDAPLKPIHTPAPAYPRSLDQAVSGEAVVEFLVCEHGRPLLPRIISASQPEFGYAAVQGVSDWRFEKPTRKGKPVITRVRVPMKFQPPEGYPGEPRISVP
jgi:TonB family protein